MCLILTILSAAVFSVIYLLGGKNAGNAVALKATLLMFWAAALMWSVDGIASVLGGEPFFDISAEDALLGAIIVASGCAFFGLVSLLQLKKAGKEISRTDVAE